ncbi:unnamed protein product [Brassica napus]|uniref:(rape) hypothetical protein n=1 Tax=Brassica napus TaxID=3708 RepID=A0A816SHJ0_BRANA|nr:unnamed protein product [Brassica napus]
MRFKMSIDASMTYHGQLPYQLDVPDLDVYCYLEPFYSDHRKVTLKLSDGSKFHFDSMDPLY